MIKSSKVLLAIGFAIVTSLANASPITSDADPALIGSTLIDFESVADGEYASLALTGVTINGIGSTLTVCSGCGGGGGEYGDVGKSLQNTGGSPASFDLLFDNAVSAFGIIGGAFNGPWTYTVFNSANAVIEVLNLSDPCCGGFFHGAANSDIKRVNLSGGGDWVVFDNLRFADKSSTVPEPDLLTLFGLALAGLGLSRSKSKQA